MVLTVAQSDFCRILRARLQRCGCSGSRQLELIEILHAIQTGGAECDSCKIGRLDFIEALAFQRGNLIASAQVEVFNGRCLGVRLERDLVWLFKTVLMD